MPWISYDDEQPSSMIALLMCFLWKSPNTNERKTTYLLIYICIMINYRTITMVYCSYAKISSLGLNHIFNAKIKILTLATKQTSWKDTGSSLQWLTHISYFRQRATNMDVTIKKFAWVCSFKLVITFILFIGLGCFDVFYNEV